MIYGVFHVETAGRVELQFKNLSFRGQVVCIDARIRLAGLKAISQSYLLIALCLQIFHSTRNANTEICFVKTHDVSECIVGDNG